MVYIEDTNKLFGPGTFLFRTYIYNIIKAELLGTVEPDYKSDTYSLSAVADEGRKLFEDRIARETKHR